MKLAEYGRRVRSIKWKLVIVDDDANKTDVALVDKRKTEMPTNNGSDGTILLMTMMHFHYERKA